MATDGCYGVNTQLAHFGESCPADGTPVVPPIYQNSLFTFPTMEGLLENMWNNPGGPPHHYSRVSNPSLELLEKKLANLEGGDACKVFASGMTAITIAIMNQVKGGDHVIVVDGCYGPVKALLTGDLPKYGVEATFVDGRDVDAIFAAVKPNTKLIYLESPTSLTFRLQDIPEVAKRAKERGIRTMIDATYNTPLMMKPLEMGIDIVCHSCTKYFSGHSDLTAGAVIASQEIIDNLVRNEVLMMGALLGPFQAWLLTRGTRTLAVRLPQHEKTANHVAGWLEQQPEVKVVHHIGLESYAQRDVFLKTMRGSTGLFSFEAKDDDRAKVMDFCNRLQLFGRGISWGGFESLVVASHVQPCDYDTPRWFIRLFCGLEDPEDLIADIANALPALR